jgi:hypothetical protein
MIHRTNRTANAAAQLWPAHVRINPIERGVLPERPIRVKIEENAPQIRGQGTQDRLDCADTQN